MINVLVLFGEPIDQAAFDAHFTDVHRPMLTDLPGLEGYRVNEVAAAASGPRPFRLVLELQFPSQEAMQEGLNSDSGQAMARDYSHFASGGVTILFCESPGPAGAPGLLLT
jgi:uncharacterized protein (TIGR02118 family)